ncbi:MAG: thioredoxin family protein [Pirellulales bacterium]
MNARFRSPRWALACISLTLATPVQAAGRSGIDWYSDMPSAWSVSRELGRPMLLFFTMDGCHYCTKMRQATLTDPRVVAEVEGGYVAATIRAASNPQLVRQLHIERFPTTLIASPDGKILAVINGYVAPAELRSRMRAARYRLTSHRP